MKWLRECFAEYARHPLPAFIGLAIIAASLVTAATVFITRHAGSEPFAPLAGSGQSATPAASSSRAPHPSPSPTPPSSAPAAPAAQPETATPQTATSRRRAAKDSHPRAPHRHDRKDHRPRHHNQPGKP
jgi:hypothetical protein